MKNIKAMLPDNIVSDYPLLVEFMTAYYAFMNNTNNPDSIIKNILTYNDIDSTIDSFKDHIFNELLVDIPDSILADRGLLSKHIKELYNKKGTEDSYRLLFRILFNKEIEISYPGDQVLKLSDGKWVQNTSFVCHVSTTIDEVVVKSAIGHKVVVSILDKNLDVRILDIIKLDYPGITILFSPSTEFPINNLYYAATVLTDGRVLVTGGTDGIYINNTAYIGTVAGGDITWVACTNLPIQMINHTSSLLADGRVLLLGGNDSPSGEISKKAYLGTIVGNTITWVLSTDLPVKMLYSATSILSDGRILVTGGTDGDTIWQSSYIGTVTGNTIAWVSATNTTVPMINHTSTVLPDGRVLLLGGIDTTTNDISIVSYIGTVTGNTIAWVTSSNLPAKMIYSTTTVLADGRLLVTGGSDAVTISDSSYIGTVTGNTIAWIAGKDLPIQMINHVACRLADGRIMLLNGVDVYSGGLSDRVYIGDAYGLYEFFFKKDFYDDFNSATSISFKHISSISIINPGINYVDTDVVELVSIDGGGININITTSNGNIVGTTIHDGGVGFTDTPILNIVSSTGTGGYILPVITDIYSGIIQNSISTVKILKTASGYIEGKAYDVTYAGGMDAAVQIKHNDENHNVKNISILKFGEYYPDNFNYVINRLTTLPDVDVIVTNGVISSITVTKPGTIGAFTPIVVGDGVGATITPILSGGIVVDITVVDGGHGYSVPPAVIFSDTSIAVNITNNKLRIYNGSYIETDGFISSDMIIYDGIYYQRYSYEIVINELFDLYKGVLKKLLHPAGYAAWAVYDLIDIILTNFTTGKIDIERNSTFIDIVFTEMLNTFEISKQLDDISDASTYGNTLGFSITKDIITDTSDSSTYGSTLGFVVNSALSDTSDSSAYVEALTFLFALILNLSDTLDTPIMYDPGNIYDSADYFAQDYVYVQEFSMTFNKSLSDVSNSATYVETINIVFI